MNQEQTQNLTSIMDTAAFLQWKRISAEVNAEKAAEQINWKKLNLFV